MQFPRTFSRRRARACEPKASAPGRRRNPRPPPLPVALAPARPVPPPAVAVRMRSEELPPASASASPCTDLISAGIAVADLTHAVSGISAEAFCGDKAPVRLAAIRLIDDRKLELRPVVLVRCEAAYTFYLRTLGAGRAGGGGGSFRRLA